MIDHQSRTSDGAILEGALPVFNYGALVWVGILYTPNVVGHQRTSRLSSNM